MLRRWAGIVGRVGRANCSAVQAMTTDTLVNKMAGC